MHCWQAWTREHMHVEIIEEVLSRSDCYYPHLECPQWSLPLVVPPPHAHDPPDMHLPKKSLLFRID